MVSKNYQAASVRAYARVRPIDPCSSWLHRHMHACRPPAMISPHGSCKEGRAGRARLFTVGLHANQSTCLHDISPSTVEPWGGKGSPLLGTEDATRRARHGFFSAAGRPVRAWPLNSWIYTRLDHIARAVHAVLLAYISPGFDFPLPPLIPSRIVRVGHSVKTRTTGLNVSCSCA